MKKKKILLSIGIAAVIFIVICSSAFVQIKNKESEKLCDNLSEITYNIVEESYMNYGNIQNSKYGDIVPPDYYEWMYYLRAIDYDNSDRAYIDRSRYDILISYHSRPDTVLHNSTRATTTYVCEYKYTTYNTPEYRDEHTYYELQNYRGGISHCTVEWKLESDGKWHIVDFIDPP